MNKKGNKWFSLISLCFISICTAGCGKSNLFDADQAFKIHTEAQENFLKDDYNYFFKYAVGTKELSKPNPITLNWKDEANSYSVSISEDASFTNPLEILTDENEIEVYNLKINTLYYWNVSYNDTISETKTFVIDSPAPRNLYIDGITNVRDLGGWNISNDKLSNQGLIYRGGRMSANEPAEIEITQKGIDEMLNVLKIKTDLDIRNTQNNETGGITTSPLGEQVNYVSVPMKSGGDYLSLNLKVLKDVFNVFGNKDNYPIYIHCSIGTDRTGIICFLINALLGVSEQSLYYDYLFSNFGNIGRRRMPSTIEDYIGVINSSSGSTFAEKTYNYLISNGVDSKDLDTIIEIMSN